MMRWPNELTKKLGITYPIFCGAMYPCSNPELVAAASDAGGIGIIQPLSLTYVYGYKLQDGLRYIQSLTTKPVGMNILVEKSSQVYENRMKEYVDIALNEGIRFFITALGNPRWVVDKVHAVGGTVFHDVVNGKFAEKALENGVDGLIGVNNWAGGHLGNLTPKELLLELKKFNVPVVCAGGVSEKNRFLEMLDLGYDGVQMGTRFIATSECKAGDEYKRAIIKATPAAIVSTYRISGVPVSVINNEKVQKEGTEANWVMRKLLRHPKGKHWARMYYTVLSFMHFKRTMKKPGKSGYADYWQAGKSVEGIDSILPVKTIIKNLVS